MELVDVHIQSNRNVLYAMEKRAVEESHLERKALLCSQAAMFAVNNLCGLYNSKKIETCLMDMAQELSIPLSDKPKPNSVLHVMTRSYVSGGHTRVCERWIEAASEEEVHAVVLIGQGDRPVPKKLEELFLKRSGSLINLNVDYVIDKALKLREIASGYETIILHIHMYDVVPLLAFGSSDFKRPILYYNHADHLFWLGCSIADKVINMRKVAEHVCTERRGISENELLPLPVEGEKITPLSLEARGQLLKELGLDAQSKIILTLASAYKYKTTEEENFLNVVEKILKEEPNAVLIAIGPSLVDQEWKEAAERMDGRIKPLGVMPYQLVADYIKIADVAIDSFPYSSLLSLLDIARYNVPCVSVCIENSLDSFEEAGIYVNTKDDLVKGVLSILSNKKSEGEETKLLQVIKKYHMPSGFRRHLQVLMDQVPKGHVIRPIVQDVGLVTSRFESSILVRKKHINRSLKERVLHFIHRLFYYYVFYLYPIGMNRKLYNYFVARGLL